MALVLGKFSCLMGMRHPPSQGILDLREERQLLCPVSKACSLWRRRDSGFLPWSGKAQPGTWLSRLWFLILSLIAWHRALYDRLAEVEHELSFKKDDILYVDDTLPQGTFGSWMAWQLDENAQKIQRGQIPSKYV